MFKILTCGSTTSSQTVWGLITSQETKVKFEIVLTQSSSPLTHQSLYPQPLPSPSRVTPPPAQLAACGL